MKIKVITLSLIATILTGCISDNPLTKMPADDAARALVQASSQGSAALNFLLQSAAFNYQECMLGNISNKDCSKLYQSMQQELEREKIRVSIADITDKALFKDLRERIQHYAYLSE